MAPRQWFQRVSDVKRHQDLFANSFGYKTSTSDYRASRIISQEIERLQVLQKQLLRQEEYLFSSKSIGSFKELRRKLEIWNNSGAASLLSNSDEIYPMIKEISQIISFNNFEQKFNILLQQNIPEITDTFSISLDNDETVDFAIREFLSRLSRLENSSKQESDFLSFRWTTSGANIAKTGSGKASAHAGLLRYVRVSIEQDQRGKRKAKFSFSDNISQRYQARITKIFDDIIRKANAQVSSMGLGQEEIDRIINKILFNIKDERIKSLFHTELFSRFLDYDLNKSASSVKGFLGEVYWNTFWRYATNGYLISSPVGTIKANGEKIPIDFVLRGLGFQVKNYHIDDNFEILFRKSMSLYGFLQERLQTGVGAFENFYISWGYNKINHDYENAEEVYGELFNRFERIMSDLEDKFQSFAEARLDRIIKLDSEFQSSVDSKLKLQGKLGVKSNVAFLIGSNIVFGSDIIESIIQSFSNGEIDLYFKEFDFDYKEPIANNVWPEPDDTSGKTLMSNSTVKYEIVMNVGALVQKAIQRLG